MACEKQSPKQAFFWGWFTGVIYFSGTVSWVTISMHLYGGLPWIISYLLMFLLVSYLAIYIGLFTLSVRWIKSRSYLIPPISWTALEYLRGHLLTGFPWNALGYSQYKNLPLIQIADLTSVYGISFLIVLSNVALFRLFKTMKEKTVSWTPLLVTLSLFIVTLLYGFDRLKKPMGRGEALSVAVVQGNIDQAIKWAEGTRDETLRIYDRLSSSFVKQPQLVVWPEAAMPFFLQNEPSYQRTIFDLSARGNFYLLLGSPAFQTASEGTIELFNSAYLISPKPTEVDRALYAERRYDKIHLVPFGEYIPLKSILFFVDKMVTGIGDFIPGKEARVWEVPPAKIGVAICYEIIFPDLVRLFVKNGANMMVTITNDAWFGRSDAPYQHFSMVVFRAIENRVPVARSANTGISGFIDAHGKILQETEIFVEDTRLERLTPGFRKTFYTVYGDFFALGCLAVLIILILLSCRRGDSNPHGVTPTRP